MMQKKYNILLVEDNLGDVRLIKEYLFEEQKRITCELLTVSTLAAATELLKQKKMDVILLDLGLPDSKDLATFRAINALVFNTPIIIITGLSNEELAVIAVKEGAQDYLMKNDLNAASLSRAILYGIEREQTEQSLKEYANIVENACDVIISTTIDGVITNWNKAAEEMYGLSALDTIGKSLTDFSSLFTQSGSQKEIIKLFRMIKSDERIDQYETIHHDKKGALINVLLTASPLKDKTQHIIGIGFFIRNITQIKTRERQAAIQYRVALTLSESSDLNNAAHGVLKTICEILQLQAGEIWFIDPSIGSLRYVASWFEHDKYRGLEQISHDLHFKFGEGLPGSIWKRAKPYWIKDLDTQSNMLTRKLPFLEKGIHSGFGFPILFKNEVMGVILFFSEQYQKSDINFKTLFTAIGNQIGSFIKQKRAEGELLYLVQHDSLTGLANRFAFEKRMEVAIHYARLHNHLIALLYLDLDNFKKINDTLGHSNGDLLLQQVGTRISQCCRHDDIIARFGGDEFIISLLRLNTTKDMAMIAQKILETIATPFMINKHEFYITASMGISIYPDDGKNVHTLLKKADLAMYMAKSNGRNNYQFCFSNMTKKIREKVILEGKLYRALKQNAFVLYYQPKVCIKNNKIIGLEALIRFHDEDHLIMPKKFIPLAEETNLIIPINEWALRTACLQVKQWLEQGICQAITVSVNVSSHQFISNFIEIIQSILHETGLDPSYLELELTENVLMNISNASILLALNKLGIKLSIDDFGTGYSSFSYLKNFQIDIIKIDQSFIADLSMNANSKAIVSAIISMAHALNITVIAEGVEHQEQLELLKSMGCDAYQGFLFSTPLPAEEIVQLMNAIKLSS